MLYLAEAVEARAHEPPPARGRAIWCTRTCRCRCACCATSSQPASARAASTQRRVRSACWNSRARSCPSTRAASSCTPAPRPIFDLYGVEDEIQRALERKVPLKSGGYLVIRPDRGDDHDRREHRRLRRPAQSRRDDLPHQSRSGGGDRAPAALRNLGGIIIIDFIDMQDEEHRRAGARGAGEGAGGATARRRTSPRSRRSAWWR